MDTDQPKVFICYAREDMADAKRLYKDLLKYNVDPWLDTEDLKVGQNWRQEIYKVMRHSSHILVLLSSHSLTKRGFVQKELKKALDILGEFPSSDIFLLPVRLEKCEPQEEELQNLQWCDLFESYEKGLTDILKVICPTGRVHLRSEPLTVSGEECWEAFQLEGHDQPRKYIRNDFEDRGEVIVDHATGLMWQKSGSSYYYNTENYKEVQAYVESLNHNQFAGFNDWRLPTIPELMSLLEPDRQSNGMFIKPIFDTPQQYYLCWSADRQSSSFDVWNVNFTHGNVSSGIRGYDVRCVRP